MATPEFPIWREKRQASASVVTTCGFYSGDPGKPLTAPPGLGCTSDTANLLWGICPTGAACGLPGVCVDSHSCTKGCGRTSFLSRSDIGTTTCTNTAVRCGAHVLIKGPASSFEFIGCDYRTTIETLYPVPLYTTANTAPTTTTDSITTSSSTGSLITTTSSFPSNTGLASSTTTPPPEQIAKSSSTNIGAIVGGTVAGIFLICATIIGALLIRRRRRNEKAHPDPPPMATMGGADFQSYAQWDSSYGPVEMGGHGPVPPSEMPGHNKFKPPSEMPGSRHPMSPIEMQGSHFK